MRVFALSDPHLALDTPGKSMDRFGPQWVDHAAGMAAAWDELVRPDDLVLVPGDISWARDLAHAAADLSWLARRPGTKLIGKGNHEHWWASRTRVRAALPEGVLAIDGDALRLGQLAVAGTRLWDIPGCSWHDLILWQGEPVSPEPTPEQAAAIEKVYRRELGRLQRALEQLDGNAPLRLAMLHYPPSGPGLPSNEVTDLLERAGVQHVVFGHLHALDPARRAEVDGTARGVHYVCASCDFIDFTPVLVCEL